MPTGLSAQTLPSDSVRTHRERLVNSLAAGVAHEFNNVLQIVRGYVAFARDTLPEGDETRGDLEQALSATDRAASLSKRMLQLARASDEGATADVADALDALRLLLKPLLGDQIGVQIDAPDHLPPVRGSDSGLRESLLNLAINARDAMPSGGELLIEAKEIGNDGVKSIRLRVEDTGSGIAPEVAESLFDPYVSTKGEGDGAGLGLALVQRFVELAGGAVHAESGPNGGARFELLLPVADPPPEDESFG